MTEQGSRRTALATGYGLATVALPIAALPAGSSTRDVVTVVVAVVAAAAFAAVFVGWAATGRNGWVGAVLVAVASLLYSVTPAGASTAIIALLVGAGTGLVVGPRPWPDPRALRVAGTIAGVAVLGAAWVLRGYGSSAVFLAAALGAAAVVLIRGLGERSDLPESADRPEPTRRGRVLVGVAVAGAVGLVAWTGGNDPQLSWFGPVVSHGPRDRPEVAITFDDGPNESATLEVTRILDDHGVKGTFFLVGRAVAARPAVARQVVADGHLVGNHSYHHDYWRWLDPRYPELGATQAVIGHDVGVCPRFFRPPHGQRTPLMNLQLARRGMVAVTWDVSAADWVTNDPDLVARRILARVRPGSIILLHDSIDGHVDADRRVVIEALPRILDGLERKGLQPVRLDRLIGGPAYLPDSDC